MNATNFLIYCQRLSIEIYTLGQNSSTADFRKEEVRNPLIAFTTTIHSERTSNANDYGLNVQ